nr:unnamed protein product [Digitaria exilis]
MWPALLSLVSASPCSSTSQLYHPSGASHRSAASELSSMAFMAAGAAPSSSSAASALMPTRPETSPLQFFHAHAARRALFRSPSRTRRSQLVCSLDATKQAVQEQSPTVKGAAAGRTDCFGVFCTTYDLREEEETKSWKKVVNVALSGAAGMISNHLLFKAIVQKGILFKQVAGHWPAEHSSSGTQGVRWEGQGALGIAMLAAIANHQGDCRSNRASSRPSPPREQCHGKGCDVVGKRDIGVELASGEVFGPDQPIALRLLGSERSFQALEGVAMELEDSLYPLLREVSIGIDPYEVFEDVEWALLIGAKPRGPGMERADLLNINGQIFAQQGKALNAVASRNVKVLVVGNPCNTNALICLKNAPDLPPKNFHALTRLDENRAKCQLALKAGVFYDMISNMTIWGNHSTTQVPDFLNARIDGKPARQVYTNGNPYGIAEDIVFSMPGRSKGDGDYELVTDVVIDGFLWDRIKKSEAELLAEKRCVMPEDDELCEITEDTMLPGEK